MRRMFRRFLSYIEGAELSVLFFLLFVFSIPFSKRMEFLSPYSYLENRFIEYTTYIVYGFEVFLCVALCIWIVNVIRKKKNVGIGNAQIFFSMALIMLCAFVSSFYSSDYTLSMYYGGVWAAIILAYLFVTNKLGSSSNIFLFFNTFVFSMVFQGIVAIIQFIKNSSLGLSLIGEYPLSPSLAGIAKTVISGSKHIRVYGTFSHPNVLALFLVLSGILCIYLFYSHKDKLYRWMILAGMLIISAALFLTFSRVAWALALVTWVYLIYKNINKKGLLSFFKNKKNIFFAVLFLLFLVALITLFASAIWWRVNPFLGTTWESLIVRVTVFSKTFELIRYHPFGVGAGSFIIQISYLLTGYPLWMAEPVHNTYLMVFAEIGFIGFFLFSYIMYKTFTLFKKIPLFMKLIFISLFVYTFFDHSFWDIRQAQYLMFIFIGLFVVYSLGIKEGEQDYS